MEANRVMIWAHIAHAVCRADIKALFLSKNKEIGLDDKTENLT
jgi:hypothetical protein